MSGAFSSWIYSPFQSAAKNYALLLQGGLACCCSRRGGVVSPDATDRPDRHRLPHRRVSGAKVRSTAHARLGRPGVLPQFRGRRFRRGRRQRVGLGAHYRRCAYECALPALTSGRAGVELSATPMTMAARAIAPGVSIMAGSASEDGDASLWCVRRCMPVRALTSVLAGRSLRLGATSPLGQQVRAIGDECDCGHAMPAVWVARAPVRQQRLAQARHRRPLRRTAIVHPRPEHR